MSGMAMKFTSLAQIEANQFVSADDRQVAADAAMARNRSADGLSLRQVIPRRS